MIDDLDISRIAGLTDEEAAKRLREDGYNELPSSKQRSGFTIALEVMREPMFMLLIAGGAIYFVLGDIHEGVMLLSFVLVIIGITFFQERRTERALEALRDLSSPRALVIRGGERKRIAGREVVRGDILILVEGDRVPADAIVLSCINLSTDESLLTGESVPVRKVPWDGRSQMVPPGGDDLPFVYSSTMVVQGRGVARVEYTGINTQIGRIGRALQDLTPEQTALQKETDRIVRNLAFAGISLCILVVTIYGLTRGDWLNGLLSGVALAMALVPEEFPVVLTIFLALGAWRISQKRVLTRRMPAIETLGSATVLCVDKTGTITMNRMSVAKLFVRNEFYDLETNTSDSLPEEFHELAEYGILASQSDPFDPMEKAIKQLGDHCLAGTEHLHTNWGLIREYPLSRKLLALSHVWKSPGNGEYLIAAKGAPEAIADLCHLDEPQLQNIDEKVNILANEGLRVIGVAKANFTLPTLPPEQHDFKFEFIGLIGLADPVRPNVAKAVEECYTAGVRIVMITGDYPGTAQNIARQIGLKPIDEFITGSQLSAMDNLELQWRIRSVNIFARVVPEQKLRLVNALKANGEIVAMTGDGVNDAPALKSADIGIAMGGRGTDVAREASALVLLDDDFSSIVQSIRLGRRIFDNLRKAMSYIFAIHVPIAGLSLIPLLFQWPLILLPAHIAFLELIIDPACSVVFEAEPEEANTMDRPPRNPKEPMLNSRTVGLSLLQGASVLAIVLIVFGIAYYRGGGEQEARALTFTALIVANLGLIFTGRSWTRTFFSTLQTPNSALWWVAGGAVLFLGLVLYVPLLRDLFRFATLHLSDLVVAFAAGLLSIMWIEGLKIVNELRRK